MATFSRRLSELRASNILDHLSESSILILPIGAVEQHGPHLPFNTDLVVAEACAQAVVDRVGDELDLWLLESLAFSKSNEHLDTPGTIWLGPETMLATLDDIGRSVAATPVKKLAFINGHGGNSSLLNVACRELRIHHGLETFLLHPSVPPDQGGPSTEEELGMGIHGGIGETSLMMHLRPELVRLELGSRYIPEHLAKDRHVKFGGTVSFGWLAHDFGPDGHIGDPTGSSPERGAKLMDAAVENLCEAFAEIAEFRFIR